jgi:orotate phosphoribosyltransferase
MVTHVKRFRDGAEAGRLLAHRLRKAGESEDTVVQGLARGGVPIGYETARGLDRERGMPLERTSDGEAGELPQTCPWHM